MTKKDYILLANAIHQAMPRYAMSPTGATGSLDKFRMAVWENIRNSIAKSLAADNPRFNEEKFKFACAGVK